MRPFLLSVFLSAFSIAVYSQSLQYGQNSNEQLIQSLHAVSEADISGWMHTLIAPEMRGRLAGDIGYDLAAQWSASQLEAWGLTPFFEDQGFFQTFDQPYTLIKDKGAISIHIPFGDSDTLVKNYNYAKDYWPWGVSGSGTITGDVVYVGYGITAPELNYNDYKHVDVTGKIVICELGIPYPGSHPDTLETWQAYREVQYKIENAVKHGAIGMLFAYHVASARPTVNPEFIFLAVADHVVDDFLIGTQKSHKEIRSQIQQSLQPASFNTGKQAGMSLSSDYFPEGKTANVVAMIEGSDPILKNEYIIIGAHLDHLGMMPVLFPGALDNASGVSIAMGIAKAIATTDINLQRSLIILLFGAEEVGLVGATHFVEHFPHPKEQIKIMINLDMVGRGNAFFAATSDLWDDLLPYFKQNNDRWVHRPIMTRSSPWAYAFRPRTDGTVFSNHQIPTVHFGARGATTRTLYHVPEDTMDQIDIEIMRDVVKLLTMTVIDMGNKAISY